MSIDLDELTQIAIKAALKAGKVIEKSMHKEIEVFEKKGGTTYASQVVTKIDKECEGIILEYLIPTCKVYNLGFLTEETEDDKSRFTKDFFWCVDPLDGTLAFINKCPGFSVAIALVARDGTPKIGVVYDPSTKIVYHAIDKQGAFKNGERWQLKSKNNYLTYVTDKKLTDTPKAAEIENLLQQKVKDLELKSYKEISGSGAVLNAIIVAENNPACFVKFPKKEKGGGSIWDFAATACIFSELNLQATNYKGEKLDLNKKEDTFMNKDGIYYASF